MASPKSSKMPDYIMKFVYESEDGCFMPNQTPAWYLPEIVQMEIRSSDIVVVSWPKSGTTWLQYIVTQLICGKNCADQDEHLFKRNIFLEFPQNPLKLEESEGLYKLAKDLPSPRLLKSHLKLSMLPTRLLKSNAKVIYIARNPKDAAVSFFNFCEKNAILPQYKDWSELFEHFYNGLLPYGDWFDNVLPWWEKRNEPNVLFIKYEDMKKNLQQAVRSISNFLEKAVSEEEVKEICTRSSLDVMTNTPYANPDIILGHIFTRSSTPFFRKGVIGDWKNYFTVAQNERFDKLYEEKLAGSGLDFDFE